jgi:hypothetical protein
MPEHNGEADQRCGVYGLPSGDETPTNCVDQKVSFTFFYGVAAQNWSQD